MTNQIVYDTIIIGSGPNGSTAAKNLTESGLKVLMLEAGPRYTHKQAYGQSL